MKNLYQTARLRRLACALALCLPCLMGRAQDVADSEADVFPNDRQRPAMFDRNGRDGFKPDPQRSAPPRGGDAHDERLEVVEKFINMPPEKLAMIRMMIERIEQMSPEEKERLRERIREVRNMDNEGHRKLMDFYGSVPWQDRVIIRQYMQSLSPEEKQRYREEFRDMSPEERKARHDEVLAAAKAAGFQAPDQPPPQEGARGDRPRRQNDQRPGGGNGALPYLPGGDPADDTTE